MSAKIVSTARNDEKALFRQISSTISLHSGDITALSVDAIVNPTNQDLLPGGGLSAHIHEAAGCLLSNECRMLRQCTEGEAKITKGYNLPAKYVIHTVGSRKQNNFILASCYRRCLELAEAHRLRTIAFPCISTGAFMFNQEVACKIALSTVRAYLMMDHAMGTDTFDKIIFSTYTEKDQKIYKDLIPVYFPDYDGELDNNHIEIERDR
ncbi:hypothetical protein BX666DRAFT_2031619 [Dichotomocladium elegans]|nr:hypothetical protein BX666DRAFT_2031619 [Dichotomocladium elegans]